MSPSQLFEPTYRAIKQRLMTGAWSPGTRLEVKRLADELVVGITPIRDSLNRLTGEGMIEAAVGAGFKVPALSQEQLSDLFRLNSTLLRGALVMRAGGWSMFHDTAPDYATRCGQLFAHVAQRTGNAEVVLSVRNLNDRLHVFRRLDEEIFPASDEEVAEIKEAINGQRLITTVDQLIYEYHAKRAEHSVGYVEALASR